MFDLIKKNQEKKQEEQMKKIIALAERIIAFLKTQDATFGEIVFAMKEALARIQQKGQEKIQPEMTKVHEGKLNDMM